MIYNSVLKNATILDGETPLIYDIGFDENGIITAIGTGIAGRDEYPLDGPYVLPGLVDTHVHFRGGKENHKETFYSGSRAARNGGITYVLDMPNNDPPITTPERLRRKRRVARRDSVVNFGLHAAVTPESLPYLEELAPLVVAFKLYMGESTGEINYSYDQLPKAFKAVTKTGKLLCVHAEDQKILDQDPSRPPEAEIEAIKYALELSHQYKVPLHICHVSTKDGLELIREAKRKGRDISCEVTPHHLFLITKDYERKVPYLQVNPRLRSQIHQDALWQGIQGGTIDNIASDHAPHTRKEKESDNPPSGIPGVETILLLILKAVNEGRLTLPQLVQLMHDNPVERFGLPDSQGKPYGYIREGNVANMTIVDPNAPWVIRNEELLTKCGWSPYHGWEGVGRHVGVVINGELHGL